MKILMTVAFSLFAPFAMAASHAEMPLSKGTITKIDTKWNKITIDHGPLENLDMPAMKMVFGIDPALLDGLTEGSDVSFVADRVNGKLTVVEITKE